MNSLPKIAIVGRMNVGKSTLFNRLSVNVKSIALDYEGVTRDFISDVVAWQGVNFELIDSGGISLRKSQDIITEKVRQLGLSLVEQADIIVFVVDGAAGITQEDQDLNKFIIKLKKPVLLVINKDDSKIARERLYEFRRLGHSLIFPISALHGTGIADLLEEMANQAKLLPAKAVEEKSKYNVVLLGKPNTGKSSLMNALLERERSIVSDIPGTTREAVSEPIKFYKETIMVTDTPGVRRKRGVTETLETMMVKSAFRAVEHADIVLLLMDGSAGKLSDQELKLACYVFEQEHKSLMILINKEDLIDEQTRAALEHDMTQYNFILKHVPILYISCKTGKNIGKIVPAVDELYQRSIAQFSDAELTQLFKQELEKRHLFYQEQELILQKAKQIKSNPMIITLFVNWPEAFGPSQLAFFENIFRAHYDLKGVPVKMVPRKR